MLPKGGESPLPSLLTSLLGGVVTLERQTDEQLRSAQTGPSSSRRVQRDGEIVGLSHEVSRTGGRHTPRV